MPFDATAARKIEALMAGRALPTHTHSRIALQPHALIVSAVPLSGEDGTLHAIAFGWLSRPSEVLSIPDPRDAVRQEELYATLGDRFERLSEYCLRRNTFPQLVLTSRSAVELLRNIADDHRFMSRSPGAARFARQLSYYTDRSEVATQQAVVVLTDLLTWHWATPLNPEREQHLGALLAAIEPESDGLEASFERAVLVPMGAATDPVFDNERLMPAMDRRRRLRKMLGVAEARGDSATAVGLRVSLTGVEQEIHARLSEVVLTMDEGVRRGVRLFREAAAPDLPEVEDWVEAERRAFASYDRMLSAGRLPPRRDGPRRGAFNLLERENAAAQAEAAVEIGDSFGRICGLLAGHALQGQVENVEATRIAGSRQTVHTLDLVTAQEGLTVRVRDEFRWGDDTRLRFVVTGYTAEGETTRVHLRVVQGTRRPGPPPEGTTMDLVRTAPDRHALGRTRRAMADRLRDGLPWTHVRGATAVRREIRRPPPADPLATVMALAAEDTA